MTAEKKLRVAIAGQWVDLNSIPYTEKARKLYPLDADAVYPEAGS